MSKASFKKAVLLNQKGNYPYLVSKMKQLVSLVERKRSTKKDS